MRKQDITYQDKINELRLDTSHPKSNGLTFILVEGDSDIRLFRKFFNLEYCKVELIPGGNKKLEEGVDELLKIYNLIIGIRDADFINLSENPYTKTNMFLTDQHDIEMCMISEDNIFETIVIEFTDIPILENILVRNKILKLIEQISLLKWLNEIENLEIKFEGTGFQDLITFQNNTIDFNEYFSRLISKSPNAKIIDIKVIKTKIEDLKAKNPNPFQLCNGHDFIKALSQFLREKGKTKNLNDDLISSIFRINYSNDLFSKTDLYSKTKEWAENKKCTIHL
jgi:hypothetical protein